MAPSKGHYSVIMFSSRRFMHYYAPARSQTLVSTSNNFVFRGPQPSMFSSTFASFPSVFPCFMLQQPVTKFTRTYFPFHRVSLQYHYISTRAASKEKFQGNFTARRSSRLLCLKRVEKTIVHPDLSEKKPVFKSRIAALFARPKRSVTKHQLRPATSRKPPAVTSSRNSRQKKNVAALQPFKQENNDILAPPLRAYEASASPTLYARSVYRRPGEVVDIATVIRNYWSIPLMGFNSILEIPVYPFEVLSDQSSAAHDMIVLPNSVFGVPIRPDIIFRAWRFYVAAYTGWTERMNLYKWEWPGTRKKQRKQNSGNARMNWRRSPGRWPGVHAKPKYRPRDHRQKLNKRVLFSALKMVLSAKFAQDQLRIVEHFNLTSHKTKHCVTYLRRLIGRRSQRVLLLHGDRIGDVNDNLRWACSGIPGVERHTPKTVSVYNLVKSGKVIMSRVALEKLIYNITVYPRRRGWTLGFATPDGLRAPRPKIVPGWNRVWLKRKRQEATMDFQSLLSKMKRHWKWSNDIKGPTKVWRHDPLQGFRLKEYTMKPAAAPWDKWEILNKKTRDSIYDQIIPTPSLEKSAVECISTDTLLQPNSSFTENVANETGLRNDIIRLRFS